MAKNYQVEYAKPLIVAKKIVHITERVYRISVFKIWQTYVLKFARKL